MDGAHAPIAHPWAEPPEEGAATEVAPGILWLRLPLPMVLDHVNIYALEDEDGWTLIDAGLSTSRTRAIWQRLLSGPLAGRPVARVLLTHHHPDHVGLAGWFQSEHGAELLATRTAWLFARMLTLDVQERPTPETVAYWRAGGMDTGVLETRLAERPFNFADSVWPMPLGFRQIRAGQVLRLAGRDWTVRLGHGHAPDHATLWCDAEGLVLGGDQLLPSISPNIGVYATEPEADPLGDWLASCAALASVARDEQLVLPGHKLPYSGLPARLRDLARHHEAALDRLRAHLADAPRTAAECFPPIFGREIRGAQYGFAFVEALAHINHLWHRGELARTRRADGAWLWHAAM